MPSNRRAVSWAPIASSDMREIGEYYRAEGAVKAAVGVLARIEMVVDHIAEMPFIGRSRNELGPGMRSAVAGPYMIIYRFEDEAVEIARVIHQRRDIIALLRPPISRH